MKKIYVVTDLGPGDGGKGGVVHKIAHMKKAKHIIKVGGAQGSHGVSNSSGDNFAFSQFGCGTFEGIGTYLSSRFIASPEGILNEATDLRYKHGIYNVFDLLKADEEVVCATPYHGILSRIKELSLGNNPRGTIGTGVGEAYRYSLSHPALTIKAKHLLLPNLRGRISSVRDQIQSDLKPLLEGNFLNEDSPAVEEEIDRLNDPGFLDYVVRRFSEAGQQLTTVNREYLKNNILSQDGVIVVESSHGVLTDHYQGFHPHTSAIRTLPCFTKAMLKELEYDGEIINIGVTRAYQIRHGAGPMPTEDSQMLESLLPGSHKADNRYQGKVRVGPLDLVLLRYAIAACGGTTSLDGLAITWFDQIQTVGSWWLCDRYKGANDLNYFTSTGEIKIRLGSDESQLAHQEQLGKNLLDCEPTLSHYNISPSLNRDKLYDLCAGVLKDKLGVDVRMISFGKSEQDKLCR